MRLLAWIRSFFMLSMLNMLDACGDARAPASGGAAGEATFVLGGLVNRGVIVDATVDTGPFRGDELTPYADGLEGSCAIDGRPNPRLEPGYRKETRAPRSVHTLLFGPGFASGGLDIAADPGSRLGEQRTMTGAPGRFAPGDRLRFAVVGGPDLAVDVTAPPLARPLVRGCAGERCPPLPRGRDLWIDWPPIANARMSFALEDGELHNLLHCHEDAALGHAVIRARFFGPTSQLVLRSHLDAEVDTMQGGWRVHVFVIGESVAVNVPLAR